MEKQVGWNLDVTNGQETGKICSLQRGLIIPRLFFTSFYYFWGKEKRSLYRGLCYVEVCYTEDFVMQRFVISWFHCQGIFKPRATNVVNQAIMDPHFEATSPTEIPQKHSKAPFPVSPFLQNAGKVYNGEYELFSLTSCRAFGQCCFQLTFR